MGEWSVGERLSVGASRGVGWRSRRVAPSECGNLALDPPSSDPFGPAVGRASQPQPQPAPASPSQREANWPYLHLLAASCAATALLMTVACLWRREARRTAWPQKEEWRRLRTSEGEGGRRQKGRAEWSGWWGRGPARGTEG